MKSLAETLIEYNDLDKLAYEDAYAREQVTELIAFIYEKTPSDIHELIKVIDNIYEAVGQRGIKK